MTTSFLSKLFAKKGQDPHLIGRGILPTPISQMRGLKKLDGNEWDPSFLSNRVVMICNVASMCGYTQVNYTDLGEMKKQLPELEIVCVPSNDFYQEPLGEGHIEKTCARYDAKALTMLEKAPVNGDKKSPIFAIAAHATATDDVEVKWNFETKFLVARDGVSIERYENAYYPNKLRERIVELISSPSAKS